MPKDTTEHQLNAQKHRIRIKERSKFYSPGTVNIQVLGSGARGTSSSIYLFSEQARYLFNCGEGTQRLAHEHRTKLTRMEHIFLTRKQWSQFGGVSGLCLTLQEIGVPQISLHGPSGIDEIFEATKKFVVLRNMKVETPECNDGEFWEDSVLRVNYVPLYKAKTEKSTTDPGNDENKKDQDDDWVDADRVEFQDNTDYYGYEDKNRFNKFSKDKETSTQKSSETAQKLSTSKKSHTDDHVMSYICKLQSRPGTLNLEKCVELGVKPGPLLGRLKNGFDVTLPNGNIVKADDVRGNACPGAVFIFVDVPDETYLQALLDNPRFTQHQAKCEKEENLALVVVHFSPEEIFSNPLYQEWIDRFSPSTKHLVVNERNTFTGYFASHRIQRQLNELDNLVFPMLKEPHPYMEVNELAVDISDYAELSPSKKFIIDTEGKREERFTDYPELGIRSCFHLRPPKGFDRFKEPYSHPDKVMEETYENSPELPALIEKFKNESNKIISRTKGERDKEYPKVTTFGTGSCIPNKTRNVSANLIQISKDNCAIFDCGEGTLGQIVRFFGRNDADEILKNLRLIFISHLHADHHLGLINILNRRRKLTDDKVILLAPSQMNSWLSFYNYRIEEIFSTYELFPCSDLISWSVEESKVEALEKRLGLEKIQTCYVKHCPHSFGISITMKNEMKSERNPKETVKITYSGDTIPCDDLVDLGMNSDILIHEATMEDDLWKDARIKMHTTVSQAIQVGKKMNARYLILTHFSQRYAKIPFIEGSVDKTNIAVAFDNMEVTLNDLPKMYLLYEPLKVMFADHFEQMEHKTLRRRFIKERQIETHLGNGNGHNTVKKFKASESD